jgi:hypothetical protein
VGWLKKKEKERTFGKKREGMSKREKWNKEKRKEKGRKIFVVGLWNKTKRFRKRRNWARTFWEILHSCFWKQLRVWFDLKLLCSDCQGVRRIQHQLASFSYRLVLGRILNL